MKHRTTRRFAIALVFIFLASCMVDDHAAAADSPVSFRWELYKSRQPDALLGVFWIDVAEGFYIYGPAQGPAGFPTQLAVQPLPETPVEMVYPETTLKPDAFDPSVMVETYSGATPVFVLLGAAGSPLPQALQLTGSATMLACSDVSCRPVDYEISQAWTLDNVQPLPAAADWLTLLDQAAVQAPPPPDIQSAAAPEPAPAGADYPELQPRYFQPGLEVATLGKALLFALLAGFILNFMPCVLPVVSLKLSGLVAAASVKNKASQRAVFREHNFFFALGVLLFFLLLSAVLGLAGMAWGGLFQQPWVLLSVTVLLFALGLSLFGVFDLPVIDLKTPGGASAGKSSKTQALFTGMLATLLATPCSGPFLGGVLGWTLQQPTAVIAMVFAAIGLGMASPYLAMAANPGLVRFFPKPGGWTLYLERAAGFFLMAVCVYLITILPEATTVETLILLLVTGFAAWMWGGWTSLSHSTARRWSVRLAALLLVLLTAGALFWPQAPGPQWEPFEHEAFLKLLGKEPLMVDFTADWCPNCKVLEATALHADNRDRWRDGYNLRFIQADLTEPSPMAQLLLQRLGSSSIPVVAVFPPGEAANQPLVLRDLFTESQMDALLHEAFE